ncbi:YcxB family protein [Pontibacillus sp. ALD_SL1]|uniref:YcxB family protein n=1 Tax=Pontibacillus sp. ALD_SL1 TaxID=2777185 RepID=UPI001A961664|nr:YcxB family protein [Pontibacillus sp. ALD_SL1]QST00982.1 YcxB family protein [Pontibacillus sp. ALD_SL1]
MEDRESVTVSGTITLDEFKKYQAYHVRRINLSFFFVLLVMFTLMFVSVIDAIWFVSIWFAALFALVPSGLFLLSVKVFNRNRAKKEFESDAVAHKEMTYTFNEEGVHQKGRRSDNYYEWSDFSSFQETPELFLLYVSKRKAILLPKRFFENQEQQEQFKTIVRERRSR